MLFGYVNASGNIILAILTQLDIVILDMLTWVDYTIVFIDSLRVGHFDREPLQAGFASNSFFFRYS